MADRSVLVRFRADVSSFVRGAAQMRAAMQTLSKDVDQGDRRLAMLVQSAMALGPALVPLSTIAVPALAGLTAGLLAAAGAGATTLIAFQGVGSALDALNRFQLDPTEANLDAVKEKMEALGPAGQEFVLFLQGLRKELQPLQDAAQQGLFPGLMEGINELLELGPQAERIIGTIAAKLGDLAEEGASELTSERWADFFDFVEREAAPTMDTWARSTGNVFEALANLLMALDPLTNQFEGGLLQTTQDFVEWSRQLDSNQGFQGFVDYVRENGPEAIETLGSLVTAIAAIVQAAAPVGEASLPILRALFDTLAAIADSPAGPVLIGVAAGFSAISRAVALGKLTQVGALATALDKIGRGKVAVAGIGAIALSLTDLDDKAGAANATMGALIGSMFGPWGALIGGLAGGVKDFTDANNDLEASLDRVHAAAERDPFNFDAQLAAIKDFEAEIGNLSDDVGKFNLSDFSPGGVLKNIKWTFTDPVREARTEAQEARVDVMALQQGLVSLNDEVQGVEFSTITLSLDEMGTVATTAVDALTNAGWSIERIQDMLRTGEGREEAAGIIRAWVAAADGVPGRAKAVRQAIADLDDQLLTTEDSAEALATALENLFGPELDLSEATDQWTLALRELNKDLAKNRTLVGDSNAALQNRAAIRDRVRDLIDLANAGAAVGESTRQFERRLQSAYDDLIETGVAADLSKKELKDYLATLNLTPKQITTLVEAVDKATPKIKNVQGEAARLEGMDPDVVIDAVNRASSTISAVSRDLFNLNGDTATTYINVVRRNFGSSPVGDSGINNADGGLIRGPGGPRDDMIPAWLSNGEFVVNAKSTRSNLGLLHSINAQGFADGGQAGLTPAEQRELERLRKKADRRDFWRDERQEDREDARELASEMRELARMQAAALRLMGRFNVSGRDDAGDTRQAMNDLLGALREAFGKDSRIVKSTDRLGDRLVDTQRAQDRAVEAYQREREQLRELRQRAQDFARNVGSNFDHEIFGQGLEFAMLQLRADRNDSRKFRRGLAGARRLGLSGAAFRAVADSGDLALLQELDTRREIRQFERLFAQRRDAQRDLGRFASQRVFGRAIDRQTRVTNRLDRRIDRLNKALERIEERVEAGAERGTRRGTEGRGRRAAAGRR